MGSGVSESHFYMWRALFALVHADDEVHDKEVRFMAEALEDVDFSEAQRVILNNDMHEAKDVRDMYGRISEPKDQALFFKYARELVWVDGTFGEKEQAMLLELQKNHVQDLNLEEIVGTVQLEIESDEPEEPVQQPKGQSASEPDEEVAIEQFTFGRFFKNLKQKFSKE